MAVRKWIPIVAGIVIFVVIVGLGLLGGLVYLVTRQVGVQTMTSATAGEEEFDKLRAVVTGRAMASEIATLIEEAIKNSGMEQAVYERFAPQLARLEKDMQETKVETRFIADLAGDEFVKRQLPAKRVAGAAEKLVELVPGGKALSAVLRLLIKT